MSEKYIITLEISIIKSRSSKTCSSKGVQLIQKEKGSVWNLFLLCAPKWNIIEPNDNDFKEFITISINIVSDFSQELHMLDAGNPLTTSEFQMIEVGIKKAL
jgi:hypothetical protein